MKASKCRGPYERERAKGGENRDGPPVGGSHAFQSSGWCLSLSADEAAEFRWEIFVRDLHQKNLLHLGLVGARTREPPSSRRSCDTSDIRPREWSALALAPEERGQRQAPGSSPPRNPEYLDSWPNEPIGKHPLTDSALLDSPSRRRDLSTFFISFSLPSELVRCPDCDRQGLRETLPDLNIGNGRCRACHGRGERDGEPCQACMETGVCQTCGGSGVTED